MKMFLEKINSEGLSHLSYIIGHGGRYRSASGL